MRRFKNVCMWGLALASGVTVGVMMLIPECIILLMAKVLGAKDVRLSDIGFVLRQFTDLRYLRAQYPIGKDRP